MTTVRPRRLLDLLAVSLTMSLAGGCVVVSDDDDDDDTANDSGPATSTATDDGATGDDDPATSNGSSPATDDGNVDDSSGGDGGGELSPECTDLCSNTETATELQADCVPITLSAEGGYLFSEQSCVDLATAYDAGVATSAMCVQCYVDAGVLAEHCTTAETTCF